MKLHIKAEFKASREAYGSPRIKQELASKSICIGKHRTARLMKELGIKARSKRAFKKSQSPLHHSPRSPNVVQRKFKECSPLPNRLWVSDITFISTQQGWLYLCVVLDVYSRKIVGYSMKENMDSLMVTTALQMALARRRIQSGLIFHSDQGVQYCSRDFRGVLERYQIEQSMSRKGDCWDNSIAESFFATIKCELVSHHNWSSRASAQAWISEWIEAFYNPKRRHSANGGMSPIDYETLTSQRTVA